ncbi:MAG: ArnT family glycosyltransferase [Candidatus Geothermincolia bacterium]
MKKLTISSNAWFLIFLLTIVLMLAGYSLLTPAGEGFDEVRHYSYISELATTGRIPNLKKDTLDAGWQRQHSNYPVQYSPAPSVEVVQGPTYQEFFQEPKAQQEKGAARWYNPTASSTYKPGKNLNSAGEHPPLYYLVMAPFFLLAKGWSFGDRLILLRLASVLLVGLSAIFFWLIIKEEKKKGLIIWLLAGTIVVLTPSFFYDLARVGNDSLCVLLGSAAAWLLLRLFRDGPKTKTIIWLGVVLGLGGLTKLFFMPVMVGVVLGIAILGYKRFGWKRVLLAGGIIIVLFVAISGWWYARNQVMYGTWTGARDLIVSSGTKPSVSLVHYLKEAAHSVLTFARSHFFSSTWSFVFISSWLFLPFVLLWGIAVVGMVVTLVKGPPDPRRRIVLFLIVLVPLFGAFAYHSHHFITVTGRGGVTPGYYPFFMWIILYGLAGIGLARLSPAKRFRPAALGVLFGAMWLVSRVGDWTLLMIYSGLGTKGAGNGLVGTPFPPGGTWTGLVRLNELMPAIAGVVLWTLGIVAQIILIFVLLYLLLKPQEHTSLELPIDGIWFPPLSMGTEKPAGGIDENEKDRGPQLVEAGSATEEAVGDNGGPQRGADDPRGG